MDKDQALARLTAIEEETKKLRAIIDAPAPVSLLPPPGKGVEFRIDGSHFHLNPARVSKAMTGPDDGPLRFPSQTVCADYCAALTTLILLRQQPGTVPPTNHKQYALEVPLSNGAFSVKVNSYQWVQSKLSLLSPTFDTVDSAADAIKAIGEARLLSMFYTLAHYNPNAK